MICCATSNNLWHWEGGRDAWEEEGGGKGARLGGEKSQIEIIT